MKIRNESQHGGILTPVSKAGDVTPEEWERETLRGCAKGAAFVLALPFVVGFVIWYLLWTTKLVASLVWGDS